MEDQIKVTINAPGIKKLQEGIDQYNQALSDLGNSLQQSYGTSNIGSATAIGMAFGAINIGADIVLTMTGLGGVGRTLGEIAEVEPSYWEVMLGDPAGPSVIPFPEDIPGSGIEVSTGISNWVSKYIRNIETLRNKGGN